MADYVRTQQQGTPTGMKTRYRDMGDETHAQVVSVRDQWTLQLISDEAENDSDKNFNVPAGREWEVLWVWVELTTVDAVDVRNMCITIYDDANDIIGEYRAGATQAVSLTRYYMFAPAVADLTAFRDTNYLMSCIAPTTFLKENYHLRVWDCNAASPAADTMIVQIMVAWQPS